MSSEEDFSFLEERPLKEGEFSESKFGHEEISATLQKIIKRCPTPFTIGLFAKWGSGKSTVANSIKKGLLTENIPVVIFDVWKHEGDELRRTFLKESVEQLNKEYGPKYFKADFVINDRLNQSVTRTSESNITLRKGLVGKLVRYSLFGLIILGCFTWGASSAGILDYLWRFLSTLAGVTSGGALLIWLIKQSVHLFAAETVIFGTDKFKDPHEFENEFGLLLQNLVHKRVVIVFDNLDRVTQDKVAEVLSTIKTFLEPKDIENGKKEVVFLIPCDARAIKQHLSNIYGTTGKYTFDSDEFLRKFFNTIIWIPDFIPGELESFAKKCLAGTKVPLLDNPYVAWLITKAFRSNPRQIIQFTNILLANYLLVAEREGADKDFPIGFLKENISQLTKYLILSQLFPDQMEELRAKKVHDLDDEQNITAKDGEPFYDFIQQTKNVQITNLRTFFTLRRSEQEKKLPGFEEFSAVLEDRKETEAKDKLFKLGDFTKPDVVTDLSQAIKNELESKNNPVSVTNVIHTLLFATSANNVFLDNTVYEEINTILNNNKKFIHNISPLLLGTELLEKDVKFRQNIITQWVAVIQSIASGTNEYQADRLYMENVFAFLSEHPDYVTDGQQTAIQKILTENLPNDIPVAKILVKSEPAQVKFTKANYITNFINTIQGSGPASDITERIKIASEFTPNILKQVGGNLIFTKFNEIQVSQNAKTPVSVEEKKQLLSAMKDFNELHLDWVKDAQDSVKDTFATSLIAGFNATVDTVEKAMFIPILTEARKYLSVAKTTEINALLSSYLTAIPPETLKTTFEELSNDSKNIFFENNLYDSSETRSINDSAFRAEFFKRTSDANKQKFIIKLFTQNIEGALQFIETLDKGDTKHVFSIFDSLWPIYDSVSLVNKEKILKYVNKNNANNDTKIRDSLTEKIIALLTNIDQPTQHVGLNAFIEASEHLSKPKLRQVVKDTFDWVRKTEITPKYQPYSLRAIYSQYEQFNEEEKKEFMQFIFEELIRKPSVKEYADLGFEILSQINPKYEERKENFDDIKTKIETDVESEISKVIISGLLTLKPTKTNTENKNFWEAIEKLSPVEN